MEYKKLGDSSLHISRIGFGCMSLRDDSYSEKIIHTAIDLGINFFDTADLYDKGANEILIGKVLKQKRQDVILATKGGNQWKEDGSGWIWNPNKKYLIQAVDKSLQRLNTEYIDLYQLHGGTITDPVEEIVETFEELVTQGKIRYYGISSIRPNVIDTWLKTSGMISVMMQYSLLDRRPEKQCLPKLLTHNVGVLARGTLAQGLLAGKPSKPYLGHTQEEVELVRLNIREAGDSSGSIPIGFVLQNQAITSAIVGIRTLDQLKDAVDALIYSSTMQNTTTAFLQKVPAHQYKEHLT